MSKPGKPIDPALRQQRRQSIINAAIDELRRHGYGGMRMDRVAAAAGISKANIYRYFDSKPSLFKAVVLSLSSAVIERLDQVVLDDQRPYADRLAQLLEVAYDSVLNTPMGDLIPVIAETAAQYPELASFFAQHVRGPLDQILLELVAAAIRAGEFRDHPAAQQMPILLGPLLAFCLQRTLVAGAGLPPQNADECRRAHLETLLDALLCVRNPPSLPAD